MTAKRVYYEGRVQGVGFRYSVKQIALGFEVMGWVKNLPDGRVELQVMGEEEEVAEFLREIAESHLESHIQNEAREEIAPLKKIRGFTIASA